MTCNNNKSYLACLNKLVDHTIILIIALLAKNLLILITLIRLKKSNRILMLLNLKLMIESGLLSIEIFLVKVTLKIGQEKYLLLILC